MMQPDRQLLLDPDEAAEIDRFNEKLRHWLSATRMRFVVVVAINVTVLTVLSIVTVGVVRNGVTVNDLAREGEQRRDETCVLFERQAQSAVTGLEATYHYLASLPHDALDDPLNQAVLAQVPSTEREARDARAPAYCNPPEVGLRTPPMGIPRRPPEVAALIGSGK